MRTLATYGCAAALVLACALHAQAVLVSCDWNSGFNNAGLVPDDNSSGWLDTRTITTSASSIESVTVTLNLSGGFNGDLYAYLSHDTGFTVLLNRVGRTADNAFGYDDSGFFITLSDQPGVLTGIHSYGGNGGAPVTGTFQSDGRATDPALVLDTDPRVSLLTSFNGLDPNGSWTLFVADLSGGEATTLLGWGLDIQAVPEPSETALAAAAGIAIFHLLVCGRRRRAAARNG